MRNEHAQERFLINLLFTSLSHIFICAAGEISQYSTKMLFYTKVYIGFLLTFVVIVAAKDRHPNVNWAFRNRHSLINNGYPCHRHIGSSRSSYSIPIDTITHLNVSNTTYASMEQIEVTWTPILNACQDDFVGIYFAETQILTGIHVIFMYDLIEISTDYISYHQYICKRRDHLYLLRNELDLIFSVFIRCL